VVSAPGLRSKVAPEATITDCEAREPVTLKIPAFTLVPPAKVLALVRVSVPAPPLLKLPAPEMIPAYVVSATGLKSRVAPEATARDWEAREPVTLKVPAFTPVAPV